MTCLYRYLALTPFVPRVSEDPFEHVGSILVNISKQEAGRKLLLDPKRGLLRQIIRQFDSPNPLRRKGVCMIDPTTGQDRESFLLFTLYFTFDSCQLETKIKITCEKNERRRAYAVDELALI